MVGYRCSELETAEVRRVDILPASFYDRDTVEVARDLLGKYLVREYRGETLVCRIMETEAYVGRMDKACHAYGYKRTPRTQTLFAPPGTAYIYLIYGMYHCLNLVTEQEGEPCAVLLRGAVPVQNRAIIAENRFGRKEEALSSYQKRHFLDGPGKLCKGLALTRAENGLALTGPPLYVCDGPVPDPAQVRVGPRVGIDYAQEAVDFPWRFWAEEDGYAVF